MRVEPMDSPDTIRLFCADQSLRCPGFAVLRCEAGMVVLERTWHLDLRNHKGCHGEQLSEIYRQISDAISPDMTFVRERAFSRFARETQALNKVVGIADLAVWRTAHTFFHEIAPTTVKLLLTGSGKATKEDVASALTHYLGQYAYATSDESDAAAVGIAWLIQNELIPSQNRKEVLDNDSSTV